MSKMVEERKSNRLIITMYVFMAITLAFMVYSLIILHKIQTSAENASYYSEYEYFDDESSTMDEIQESINSISNKVDYIYDEVY